MVIMDFFYTLGDVAARAGVAPVSVWRWVRDGKLSSQQVGREVLIPKWEAEAFIEARKATQTASPGNRLYGQPGQPVRLESQDGH